MLNIFLSVFGSIMKVIGVIFSPLILLILGIMLSFIFFHAYHYKKGMRITPSEHKYKKQSFFKRIFLQFPKQLSLDIYNRDPLSFNEFGLHMFCGEQGSGKTTSVVHKLLELKQKYPKTKIRTNMNYAYEDGSITHWQDLVSNDNGIYGQVEVLDEIQAWFSSNQSKDFPPDMLAEISQQRKQRKMLIGTAQVFGRIAKPIREQTHFVYLPMTLFGCLTFVRITKARYYNEETQGFDRYIGYYFFVHNEQIRNAFDTYKKIEKYSKDGFKSDLTRFKEGA